MCFAVRYFPLKVFKLLNFAQHFKDLEKHKKCTLLKHKTSKLRTFKAKYRKHLLKMIF